jgi:large subunit ribosomal protein L17
MARGASPWQQTAGWRVLERLPITEAEMTDKSQANGDAVSDDTSTDEAAAAGSESPEEGSAAMDAAEDAVEN